MSGVWGGEGGEASKGSLSDLGCAGTWKVITVRRERDEYLVSPGIAASGSMEGSFRVPHCPVWGVDCRASLSEFGSQPCPSRCDPGLPHYRPMPQLSRLWSDGDDSTHFRAVERLKSAGRYQRFLRVFRTC